MKVTQKKLADGNIALEATATADEVNRVLQAAHIAFAQSMGLKPEEGKSVEQVAEEQMGIKDLDSIVKESAIEALVPVALDRKNIVPAYPPKADPKGPLKRSQEFRFEVIVAPKPEYELTSYEPVEFSAPAYAFNEAAVDAQLDQMASRYTSYEKDEDAADREVQSGDHVKIALEAFEGDKRLDGLSTTGRTYSVGQGYMPEGFDEQIVGMKPGETKSFTFEGPSFDDDFNEITQTVDATVTLQEIQKETKPVIDDEWISTNMPMYKGVADLRADIARSMEANDRLQYDSYIRQMAAAELAKRFEGSIADEVYEAMRAQMMQNIQMDLQQQGKTWEQFLEENGGEQQFGMMMMLEVRQMLVQGYALDAVFRHEHLTLDDDDIYAACQAMNPQMNPKQMRQQLEESGRGFALRESAERLKANKWIVENAKIDYQKSEQ